MMHSKYPSVNKSSKGNLWRDNTLKPCSRNILEMLRKKANHVKWTTKLKARSHNRMSWLYFRYIPPISTFSYLSSSTVSLSSQVVSDVKILIVKKFNNSKVERIITSETYWTYL